MARNVVYTNDAIRQLKALKAYDQKAVVAGIETHLLENDPAETSGHKRKLDTPLPEAKYRLKIEPWRVFYAIEKTGDDVKVTVALIGRKAGNKLIVEGKEYLI